MSAHRKSRNPFTSYQFISVIELFSPHGRHVKTCPLDERPMLARITFREILHRAVGHPEAVINNCGDAFVLILLTTGLPLDAIPTDYTVDVGKLTLTYYQHEELEDRSLHYNVLTGHLLVLYKELHSYWQISEDTAVFEYDEAPLFPNRKKPIA